MPHHLKLVEVAHMLEHFADSSKAIELPVEALPELEPLTGENPTLPPQYIQIREGVYRVTVERKRLQVELFEKKALISLALASAPSKGAALLTGGILGGLLGAMLAPKKGGWLAGALAGAAVGSLSRSPSPKDDAHTLTVEDEKTLSILYLKYDPATDQWIAHEKSAPSSAAETEIKMTPTAQQA